MDESKEEEAFAQLQLKLNAVLMAKDPDPTLSEATEDFDPDGLGEFDAEYSNLNGAMDEIDAFMNSLEQKNDSLYAKLQDLLQENRATLQAFQEEKEAKETTESSGSNPPTA